MLPAKRIAKRNPINLAKERGRNPISKLKVCRTKAWCENKGMELAVKANIWTGAALRRYGAHKLVLASYDLLQFTRHWLGSTINLERSKYWKSACLLIQRDTLDASTNNFKRQGNLLREKSTWQSTIYYAVMELYWRLVWWSVNNEMMKSIRTYAMRCDATFHRTMCHVFSETLECRGPWHALRNHSSTISISQIKF